MVRIKALLELVRAGRAVVPEGAFTLHLVAAAACQATLLDDLACADRLAMGEGKVAIPATVPRIAHADPFPHSIASSMPAAAPRPH